MLFSWQKVLWDVENNCIIWLTINWKHEESKTSQKVLLPIKYKKLFVHKPYLRKTSYVFNEIEI